MDLEKTRAEIDQIDDQIAVLFNKRMNLVDDVVKAKKEQNKSVNDPEREKKRTMKLSMLPLVIRK